MENRLDVLLSARKPILTYVGNKLTNQGVTTYLKGRVYCSGVEILYEKILQAHLLGHHLGGEKSCSSTKSSYCIKEKGRHITRKLPSPLCDT